MLAKILLTAALLVSAQIGAHCEDLPENDYDCYELYAKDSDEPQDQQKQDQQINFCRGKLEEAVASFSPELSKFIDTYARSVNEEKIYDLYINADDLIEPVAEMVKMWAIEKSGQDQLPEAELSELFEEGYKNFFVNCRAVYSPTIKHLGAISEALYSPGPLAQICRQDQFLQDQLRKAAICGEVIGMARVYGREEREKFTQDVKEAFLKTAKQSV